MTEIALTIAGSDSGGGAGIQADLRTFAFHRVHGTSAITCVTAQNTQGVTDVVAMSPQMVVAQLKAIAKDMSVAAAKTGMLLNGEIIETTSRFLQNNPFPHLVVDPVMVSRAGVQLIDNEAIASLKKLLLPQATIITPNLYEAQILSELTIETREDMELAARKIYQQSGKVVLVKGGALTATNRNTDIWFDGNEVRTLTEERIETKNTHGTGCTLSAAIAANLALGMDLWAAVQKAKNYVTTALRYSLDVGKGSGPVGHFFPLLESS